MAEIHIHPSLLRFTDNQQIVQLPIFTVGELIPHLCEKFPRLSATLINALGNLTPYVNFYIDGKHLNTYEKQATLSPNAKIDLITSLVGG